LRFPVPIGTVFDSASDGGQLEGDEVVWDLGRLEPGASGKRWVTLQLGSGLVSGDLIEVESAEISGTRESDFQFQTTQRDAVVRVEDVPDLVFSIDTPAEPLRSGSISPIHLTVANQGSEVKQNVRLEMFIPALLQAVEDASLSDFGDCTDVDTGETRCASGETAFWTLGPIQPGEGKTVTIPPETRLTTQNSDAGRLIEFFGRAFADGTTDVWERQSVAIDNARPLNLEIDADANPVASDTTIDYRIAAGNQAQVAATGTTLALPIPVGTSVLSADGNAEIGADVVTWNMGTLEAGQATRRNLTLSLDAPLDPGDILELGSGALAADGMPTTRNATTVRTKNDRDLNQVLSLTPETALPGATIFADTVVNNDSAVQVTDVMADIAVLGLIESFDIGLMNPGTSESRTLELTIGAFELGALLNFSSRLRTSSTDGDFQTRTLIVGEQVPPPPPPDPEIEVSGNGIEISDGDTTPSAADGTDFGSADFEGETLQRSFVIANTNTGDLEITSVSISGPNRADFRIVSPPASTIAGGEQSTLTIEFNPDNVGLRTATVSIGNNDPDEAPYTFAIAGEGADPSGELVFKDGFE
jgi:hypothetical protein